MKLSVIAIFAATAGLAQVGAAPLRITLVSEGGVFIPSPEVANVAAIRFGHAVPPMPSINQYTNLDNEIEHHRVIPNHRRPHGPCGGIRRNRFRQKAIEISNAFRKAFGLPLIEHHRFHGRPGHKLVSTGTGFVSVSPNDRFTILPVGQPGLTGHPHPHHRFHQHGQSFMRRLHFSLMNLGPWEGRAVAFVLGCGIGVLLRMIWVLFIVGYRAIRGPKPEEREYAEVIFIEEEIAPPSYPVDVKVPIEDVKTPVEETK